MNESATRCLVCGTELDVKADTKKAAGVSAKRLPEITLSLPAALGLLALFITLGAVVVFLILNNANGTAAEPGEQIAQEAGTPTTSPTITITPTVTMTPTQEPTWTPLPPIPYTVKSGETCSDVAAAFGISIQSIILENNLTADCTLFEGDELSIPQPTPTASPQPTATLSDVEKTEVACEVLDYTVVSGDTLSTIADTYNISQATIREYNSLPNDTVFEGMNLRIPLCEREPTPGPTPTATQQPPYPGPNLLLPADGASFVGANSAITLQWAAVGEIEGDEAYAVTIVDLTSEDKTPVTDYVTDTSFIIPQSLAPTDGRPHVFRWSVFIARQIGGDEEDNQNWVSAGNLSIERVFSWYATGAAASTPTP
ncbi:LysM peptidoglycan-binding domain-containing protein [bacterium]|nr:LysM peptidoglycan-binding domain-containing protein [bacterium]